MKSLCVIYGWRTNYSNWNPLPPKLALSFRHLSPTEPAPTRMKPVAVPPKAWATMKLCVKPTSMIGKLLSWIGSARDHRMQAALRAILENVREDFEFVQRELFKIARAVGGLDGTWPALYRRAGFLVDDSDAGSLSIGASDDSDED